MFFFVSLSVCFGFGPSKSLDLAGLGNQLAIASSPDWAANHTEGFPVGQPSVPVKSEISSGTLRLFLAG